MAVKIKLKRLGKIRAPYYRIVVADARTKRDGRAIEEIGKYHPKAEPSFIEVNSDRAQHWLSVGAQPTDPVRKIFEITGDWQKFKGLPGTEGTLKTAAPKEDRKEIFAAAVKETLGDAAPKGRAKSGAAKDAEPSTGKAAKAVAKDAPAKADKPARAKSAEQPAKAKSGGTADDAKAGGAKAADVKVADAKASDAKASDAKASDAKADGEAKAKPKSASARADAQDAVDDKADAADGKAEAGAAEPEAKAGAGAAKSKAAKADEAKVAAEPPAADPEPASEG